MNLQTANRPLDRRQFLATTTAGLVMTSAGGTADLPQSPQRDLTRKIRAGVLGLAYSHAAEKCRLLRESADYQLLGAWAETATLADEYRAKGVSILTQAEVLERAEVILVESEVSQHASLARKVLDAGRHLHLEKPPALNPGEMETLIRLADERNCLLQVGYMWRHHPGLIHAFNLIQQGALGEVFLIRISIDNQLDATRRTEWAKFPGGVLFELGSHVIDVVVRLLGRPDRVTPFLRTSSSSKADKLADTTVAILEFPRTTVVITSTAQRHNANENRSFEFCGTRGNALLQPIEPPQLSIDLAAPMIDLPKGRSTVALPRFQRYLGEFNELAHSIRSGNPLAVSLATEHIVQETLLRCVGVL